MSEIMMEARSLHRRFGGLRAVSDVSLAIHRNEVHAVIGPNGAGKSTLINLLSGDIPVSEGEVRLGDRGALGALLGNERIVLGRSRLEPLEHSGLRL